MANTAIRRDPMSGDYTSKGTWSFWIKNTQPHVGTLSNNENKGIFMLRKGNSYTASRLRIYLDDNDKLIFELKDSGGSDDSFIKTNAQLFDYSAWYHICMSYDSTLGTAADRLKMWINGKDARTELGGFQSDDQVSSNFQYLASSAMMLSLGRVDENNGVSRYFNGSMAECYFIYGSTYDVSTFGETDSTTGEWVPKLDIASGITFGSQGFYFKFNNSADMKADSSGNSNTYVIDGTMTQTKDTPSDPFNQINTLVKTYGGSPTFSNANLTYEGTSSWNYPVASYGADSGKFYWECNFTNINNNGGLGVVSQAFSTSNLENNGTAYNSTDGAVLYWHDGSKYINGSNSTYGSAITTNTVVGVALNLDSATKTVTYYLNNVSQGAIDLPTNMQTDFVYPVLMGNSGSQTYKAQYNFGSGYFGTSAVTSADTSSGGIFEFAPPANHKPWSTVKGLNQ
tara:strand:- start:1109 stop:2473 length:1365 start_codon:yes stop_codon:yes gene_type:complete